MAAQTDPAELDQYLEAGWQLIPLHSHDYFDQHHGRRRERGKSPLHRNWTTRPYDSAAQRRHMEEGNNVGVRLRAGDLVLDIDPRAFPEGDDPFRRLCEDVGLDPGLFPTVETGSGGLHLYMTKPGDVSVRDSLPDYPGVEFKTLGRQVVAAGSIHPSTKRVYRWDFLRPDLRDAPEAPERLLMVARRPQGAAATGGGEHTQEEVAAMLDALDPEDFRGHDEWLTLMQACHHASAGDARAEFVEWSTRDPEYADRGSEIGRRWDSLHADDSGRRVTYRTLYKMLRDRDKGDAIPRAPAAEDFEGEDLEPPEPGVEEHERRSLLERTNDDCAVVIRGNTVRIMMRVPDPDAEGRRPYWVAMTRHDFDNYHANKRVQRGDSAVPLSKAWMEWPGRRTYKGVTFEPERDSPDFLNLWTGWAVEPRRGDWSLLRELLEDVLCDGDRDMFEYVMDWTAHLVQRPSATAETAVCFQGEKGVGKGTWGRALCALAGRHGLHVSSSDRFTGRFNAHLRDCLVLFADEAVKPYDREAESRLKQLITEPRLAYEAKGVDVLPGRNMVHVVMASNDEWFVPMGLRDERRFALQRANSSRRGDHAFFGALNRQLRGGGLSALLWDMMARDIRGWHPRERLPATRASAEQKMRNLDPPATWWANILLEGELPFEHRGDWRRGPVTVFKPDLRDDFERHARRGGYNAWSSNRGLEMAFAKELRRLVGGHGDFSDRRREPTGGARPDLPEHGDGRAWAYRLPSLADCRRTFEDMVGEPLDWPRAPDPDPLED